MPKAPLKPRHVEAPQPGRLAFIASAKKMRRMREETEQTLEKCLGNLRKIVEREAQNTLRLQSWQVLLPGQERFIIALHAGGAPGVMGLMAVTSSGPNIQFDTLPKHLQVEICERVAAIVC